MSRFGSKIHAAYIDCKIFLVPKTLKKKRVGNGLVSKFEKKPKFSNFFHIFEQSDVIWALKPDSYIIVVYPAKGFFKLPVQKKVEDKKKCHGWF